jgi:hypothetical protein
MLQGPKSGKSKQNPTPQEEAPGTRYLSDDGRFLVVPVAAIRKMLISAAKGMKHSENKKLGLPALISAHVHIEPEDGYCTLHRNGKPIGADEYAVDARRVVLQKRSIIRGRAKVELPWSLDLPIPYDDTYLGRGFPDQLREIAEKAGAGIGLLDFRPEKSGWFGKFTATIT